MCWLAVVSTTFGSAAWGAESGTEVGLVADYSPARNTHSIVRADGTTVPVMLGTLVMAGDHVKVAGSGHVFVQLNDGTQRDVGPGEWVVPDVKPLGAVAQLLRSLPRLLDVQARIAASASTRGAEECDGTKPSPIDAPILRSTSKLSAGKQNLALGWFGGCAPYAVTVTKGETSIAAAKDLQRRQQQFADLDLQPGRYTIRIEDKRGNHKQFALDVVPNAPAPPADLEGGDTATASIARALWLAELDGGAWRLESFKTLRPLIVQREKLASLIADYLFVAAEGSAPTATNGPQ
jgi:hypothetical protein